MSLEPVVYTTDSLFAKHHDHDTAVLEVSKQVRSFHATQTPFRIYHGSTNSTRKSTRSRNNTIDVSQFKNILGIDLVARLVFVESNCPMDALLDYCLQQNHALPVIPEFPGITVGGAFSGTSGESSSFRYGMFHNTVKRIEIVLGNGDIVVASDAVRQDLFHGAAATLGTLGVVTLLAIQIVPIERHVSLTYFRVSSMAEAIDAVEKYQTDDSIDFIDGMFFARDRGVLCVGKFTSTCADGNFVRYGRRQDQWFYISAEQRSINEASWTEVMPTRDYYFRHNLGAFWVSKYTFQYFGIPFNRLTRYLLHQYTHTRIMYHALHQSGLTDQYIIQDVSVPFDESVAFFSYLEDNFAKYPLWICPLRTGALTANTRTTVGSRVQASKFHAPTMMNFGIWGPGSTDPAAAWAWNRRLEAEVRSRQGQKWLYANTFYTEEEFWTIYDKQDELRNKYHATSLPTLYDKLAPNDVAMTNKTSHNSFDPFHTIQCWLWDVWPVKGLYGWAHSILFAEYLLSKPVRPE